MGLQGPRCLCVLVGVELQGGRKEPWVSSQGAASQLGGSGPEAPMSLTTARSEPGEGEGCLLQRAQRCWVPEASRQAWLEVCRLLGVGEHWREESEAGSRGRISWPGLWPPPQGQGSCHVCLCARQGSPAWAWAGIFSVKVAPYSLCLDGPQEDLG